MSATVRCPRCGATVSNALGPCDQCRAPIDPSTSMTRNGCKVRAGQLGTVVDSPTPAGGQEVRYTAPTGARSETSLDAGRLTVQIKPPVDVGTRGESRVLACVVAHLAMSGTASTPLPASDKRGEDRVLQISGDRVALQVVTAAPDALFWARVARGSADAHATLAEAASWIERAISDKAMSYPRAFKSSMLLAIDVAHMGALASPALGTHYLQTYGDPATRHAFGGVWLVGPTEHHVLRLGNSRW